MTPVHWHQNQIEMRERVVLLEKEAGSELSRWGGSEGSEGRPSAELVFASAVLKYVQQHHSEREGVTGSVSINM